MAGRRGVFTLCSGRPCKTLLTLLVPDSTCPILSAARRTQDRACRMHDSNAGPSAQHPAIQVTALDFDDVRRDI